MTKRGGSRRDDQVLDDDDEGAFPGGPGVEPDALGLGVEIRRTAEGHGVLVPRALGRLTGEAAEIAAELQAIALHRAELLRLLGEAIADAREAGVSWSVIGWCVGTTGDAANKRWSSA